MLNELCRKPIGAGFVIVVSFRNRLSRSFRENSFAFRGHTLFAQPFRGTFRERSPKIDCGHICVQ